MSFRPAQQYSLINQFVLCARFAHTPLVPTCWTICACATPFLRLAQRWWRPKCLAEEPLHGTCLWRADTVKCIVSETRWRLDERTAEIARERVAKRCVEGSIGARAEEEHC